MTKICSKCGEEKDVGKFHKDNSRKDGLTIQCKKCRAESDKKRRKIKLLNDPQYYQKASKKNRAAYPEYYREISRKWNVEQSETLSNWFIIKRLRILKPDIPIYKKVLRRYGMTLSQFIKIKRALFKIKRGENLMKVKEDISQLTGGKEIMEAAIKRFLAAGNDKDFVSIGNMIIGFVQVGVNHTKAMTEAKRTALDTAKFNHQLQGAMPQLQNIEKQNNLLPVFTREKKEDEKLSWFEIKQLVTQWHQTFSNGGPKDFLPGAHQFEETGPQWETLIGAIYDRGGFEEVANKLGLRFEK